MSHGLSGGKAFQTEGSTEAKTSGQEHAGGKEAGVPGTE